MKRLKITLLCSCLILILTIYNIFSFSFFNSDYKLNSNIKSRGVITSINLGDGYNTLTIKSNVITRAYIDKIGKLKVGDKIFFTYDKKSIDEQTIPNSFDYKKYLKSVNVRNVITIKSYKIIGKSFLHSTKGLLLNIIAYKKCASYIKTFLFADKSSIDLNVKNSYVGNGISHLLCVSGFHVAFLLSFLKKVLRKIFKKERTILLFLITFCFLYLFLTDFSVSLLRAVIMYFLNYFNKRLNLGLNKYLIFLLTLNLCIFNRTFVIYSSSFWYSFILSFFLMNYENNIDLYFLNTFKIALYAFIISMPLTIYFNYYINYFSVVYNIFSSFFICYIAYPVSFLAVVFPLADNILFKMLTLFETISLYVGNSLKTVIIFSKLHPIFIVILYFIIFFYVKRRKIIYIIMYLLVLFFMYLVPYFVNKASVFYLDVKQGDMIVIYSNYLKNVILIDSGGIVGDEYLPQNILRFLYSKGIKKVDTWLFTHGDYDHMGEAINLVNNFKVENVIFNCGEYNYLESKLIEVLEKKNIKYYSCIKELNIDKYKLQFLNTKEYDNENDNSSVIYFNYEGYKFLFMGDAGVSKEKDILDKYSLKDIDFLKVGHHGSNTSSSEYFINKINPKYSLISVGKNNRYGHPKDEVLETLKNSKIYRTDIDGSIEIKLNKNGYEIRTCPP